MVETSDDNDDADDKNEEDNDKGDNDDKAVNATEEEDEEDNKFSRFSELARNFWLAVKRRGKSGEIKGSFPNDLIVDIIFKMETGQEGKLDLRKSISSFSTNSR